MVTEPLLFNLPCLLVNWHLQEGSPPFPLWYPRPDKKQSQLKEIYKDMAKNEQGSVIAVVEF